MAQPYVYRPLESLSTNRLIKILPEKVDGCVACVISHFESSEAPAYTALSYCWGDPTPTGKIYIGDEPGAMHARLLHENLLRFVESMWSQEEFNTYFWTDSLCLDQENNQEKSHQVKRMGRIYALADEVLIWLGHEKDTYEDMNTVMCYLQQPPTFLFLRYGYGFIEPTNSAAFASVSRLSYAPYWRRTWIIQEVVLARHPTLASGRARLKLEDYYDLIHDLYRSYDKHVEELCGLRELRNHRYLWDLLGGLQADRECTRAIDKVYSLLGLAVDEFEGEHISELLEVNYDKTSVHVFWDTVFECKPAAGSIYRNPRNSMFVLGSFMPENMTKYDSLEHYTCTQSLYNTSDRKRIFGSTALRVCDAVNFYIDKHHTTQWYRAFYRLVRKTLDLDLSHVQYAALIGLALSAEETEIQVGVQSTGLHKLSTAAQSIRGSRSHRLLRSGDSWKLVTDTEPHDCRCTKLPFAWAKVPSYAFEMPEIGFRIAFIGASDESRERSNSS